MAEPSADAMDADTEYDGFIEALKATWPDDDWFRFDEVVGRRLSECAHGVASAVLRLHSKRTFDGDGYGWSVCAEDRQAWPCATVKALADVLGDEGIKS